MRKHIIAGTTIAIVVVLTLFLFMRGDSSPKINISQQLQHLENFDAKSLKGKYTIVHFWAKWCEPCAEEIPHLVSFVKAAAAEPQLSKSLNILAVSLDPSLEESRSILPDHGEGYPANFILASDPEHKVAEEMGSYQYPETYFIDPDGNVIEKWVGPQKWDKPEVMEFFKSKVKAP